VKTASGNINFWDIWTEGPNVRTRWGKLGTDKPLEDLYVAEGKNVGRKNETTPEEQAAKEAQAKFEKQLRLKYVMSVEEAESNLNLKPMRAYVWDKKRAAKVKWPVDVQPKFNGVRCMAYNLPNGTVRLMSRGGKDYSMPHVQAELIGRIPEHWCLDGELYAHGVSLQTIRSYIETPQPKTLMVMLYCYDVCALPPLGKADLEAPWSKRKQALEYFFQQNPQLQYVELSPCNEAHSEPDVRTLHDLWVSKGFEGAMVRTAKGKYRMAAKSVDLLKYKTFQDAEFKVVGWDVGKDGVIKYTCEQEEGKLFEVRPKGDEEERKALLMTADEDVGKLLTVRFQERSDDNIPIFPVGVAFRPAEDMD